MAELDFGNIYNTNGEIIQLRYARKRADSGNPVLAMKNSKGVVLLVAKPRLSPLHIHESDERIRRITSKAYMAYSGILTDGLLISKLVRDAARDYTSQYGTELSSNYLKKIIFDYLYLFTSSMSLRLVGANFLTISKENNIFQILLGEPNGKVSRWNAYAIGTGSRRALTELEKLDLEFMDIKGMIDQGIKILYKCHDPLNDPSFDLEIGYISDETDFVRVDNSDVSDIINKYKDLSIDDE